MKRVIYTIVLLSFFVIPVKASEFSSKSIPEEAQTYITENPSVFWCDIKQVVSDAMKELRPNVNRAASTCLKVIAVTLLGSIVSQFSSTAKFSCRLVVIISTSLLLLHSSKSLMELGENTVQEISEYGKLLLPVLTGSLAAQGAFTTSTALYTGTALFSSVLNMVVSKILIPILYLFLCVCIGYSILADELLKRIRNFLKWLMTWSLKWILYLFTGYMSISGVISGTVDSSALKATKLVISGAVPVVGSIMSDASETILVSAGIMKNSVGSYGLVVLISLLIGPFLEIGVHYILIKATAAITAVIAGKETTGIIDDYASIMGYVLAMTGISCLLLMIGIVCIMKGLG